MLQNLTYNAKKEEGFTLVELLIVVAIIAILAAIAIPQFGAYRKRGWAATMNSDARNAFTASQAIFADLPMSTAVTCLQAQSGGYTMSPVASCAGTVNSDGTGSFTITPIGVAAGNVTAATITGLGAFNEPDALGNSGARSVPI